jgi:rod shape-determining protein MreC
MRKRTKRSRQVKTFLFFGLALTLVLIFLISTVGRQEFSASHKLALEFVGVLQSGTTRVVSAVRGGWNGYVALWGVREENQRLRIDLQRAQADLVKYREAMANNVRLEKLLNLKNELDAPFITAQIVGRDPSQWFNTVIINQGTSDGVQMDMPVVSAEGVVGQVRNASPHFAKILLANDPNSAIDVLLQESRVQGIVKGNGKGFDLQYVLKNNEVNVGDTVLTSGMGGVFPKGLPLGTVEKVVRNRRGMFQQIEVTPAVNFEQLEYLVIILQEKSLAEEE